MGGNLSYAPIRAATEWQAEGNCYQTYFTETFFPREAGVSLDALVFCNGGEMPDGSVMKVCPVKVECLQWARKTKQPDGIWGGVRFGNAQQRGEKLKKKKGES